MVIHKQATIESFQRKAEAYRREAKVFYCYLEAAGDYDKEIILELRAKLGGMVKDRRIVMDDKNTFSLIKEKSFYRHGLLHEDYVFRINGLRKELLGIDMELGVSYASDLPYLVDVKIKHYGLERHHFVFSVEREIYGVACESEGLFFSAFPVLDFFIDSDKLYRTFFMGADSIDLLKMDFISPEERMMKFMNEKKKASKW